ncbi:unnamed protein product [Brachionus calyciflorus]|uniref:MULE transposase domain-containing protein n=1 Tax=Brachionus calyciflorus TaxID=104777 RepID=A0A813WV59_9BILA|nr:unnamed protein product [Brachionus calyciflorus]
MLKKAAIEMGFLLDSKSFMTDFEFGLIKAIIFHFNSAELKGCHFHFSQCLWRHLSTIDLKRKYSTNSNFRLWIKKIISLAFVPLDMIDSVYDIIKRDIPKNEKISTDKMLSYFESTLSNRRFGRVIWNHSNTQGPRTNNNLEGFHSKFNHLHIFKLIKLFQGFEALYAVKFERIKNGLEVVKRRKEYVDQDKNIKALNEDLRNNLITSENFISQAAYLIGTDAK